MAGSALLPWEAPLPLATVGGLDGDWTSAGGGAGRRGGAQLWEAGCWHQQGPLRPPSLNNHPQNMQMV